MLKKDAFPRRYAPVLMWLSLVGLALGCFDDFSRARAACTNADIRRERQRFIGQYDRPISVTVPTIYFPVSLPLGTTSARKIKAEIKLVRHLAKERRREKNERCRRSLEANIAASLRRIARWRRLDERFDFTDKWKVIGAAGSGVNYTVRFSRLNRGTGFMEGTWSDRFDNSGKVWASKRFNVAVGYLEDGINPNLYPKFVMRIKRTSRNKFTGAVSFNLPGGIRRVGWTGRRK